MLRWSTLLAIAGLLASACGADSDSLAAGQTDPGPALAQTTNDIARCDPTATHPSAPDDWYRDTPKYVGNEQPTEAVQQWASKLPGFEQVWIDRDHNGWVTVGFDRDVELRQQEILERFPNDGVVAVLVDWDLSELRRLQDRVTRHLAEQGVTSFATAASTQLGLVQISLGVLTEERLAAVAEFVGEPICVEGLDPATAILDGPQPQSGDGWRLLQLSGFSRARGDRPAATPGPPPTPGGVILGKRLELATTAEQLHVMWNAPMFLATNAPFPDVDFDGEIVVLVSDIESGSCPVRFDGIEVDVNQLVLNQVVPDTYTMCTSDANTITYAVAIDRASLPPGQFTIVGPTSLWVGTELTAPGAAVANDATFAPPNTGATPAPLPPGFQPSARPTAPLPPGVGPAEPAPRPAQFPIVIEPGFPSTYDLPSNCFLSLGPVNGFVWQIGDLNAGGGPPDLWLTTVDSAGQLQAEFLLLANGSDEPTLEITVADLTQTYQIADNALPTC